MTPNEITTLIASSYDKPLDLPFKLMIMEHVKTLRSNFIRQSLQQHPKDRKFFRQTIYLTMQNESEVPCDLPVKLCDVSASVAVPKPLRANMVLFDYVGAINGTNPFQEVSPGMIGLLKAGKYSKDRVEYSLVNDKIIVYAQNLPMIRADYIADDPMDLHDMTCSVDGTACNAWDTEYPVTGEIMQKILRYIPEQLVPVKTGMLLPENTEVSVDEANDINK